MELKEILLKTDLSELIIPIQDAIEELELAGEEIDEDGFIASINDELYRISEGKYYYPELYAYNIIKMYCKNYECDLTMEE